MFYNVKNIVVDIGNVCVFEDDEALLDAFRDLVGEEMFEETWRYLLLGYIGVEDCLHQYEEEEPELCKRIQEMLEPENMAQMLPLNGEVIQILDALKKEHGYRVFYLSNATEMMRDYVQNVLCFDQFFDGGIFSCDSHYRKPHGVAYQTLLDKYDLDPEETLFFDDKERNVWGAWKIGMDAKQYKEPNDIWRGVYPAEIV